MSSLIVQLVILKGTFMILKLVNSILETLSKKTTKKLTEMRSKIVTS